MFSPIDRLVDGLTQVSQQRYGQRFVWPLATTIAMLQLIRSSISRSDRWLCSFIIATFKPPMFTSLVVGFWKPSSEKIDPSTNFSRCLNLKFLVYFPPDIPCFGTTFAPTEFDITDMQRNVSVWTHLWHIIRLLAVVQMPTRWFSVWHCVHLQAGGVPVSQYENRWINNVQKDRTVNCVLLQ